MNHKQIVTLEMKEHHNRSQKSQWSGKYTFNLISHFLWFQYQVNVLSDV